ncbi:Lovastatin diketide synthase mokB [Penicillium rolfsii]|nr:Lovastatin diketide synthase mokB [Penicillium rolfsii]
MGDNISLGPIALVGISLRLPGGIKDLNGLWSLLQSGTSTWTLVPTDRYASKAFHHRSLESSKDTSIPLGGYFLADGIRFFDHAFFRLTEAQAEALDPQQRLLLELAYEALESAGLSRGELAGSATSVYAASSSKDYERQLYKDPLEFPLECNANVNLISHALDLSGPSITLESTSSDSLVAVHLACQSLRDGESDTAIVAASNLILSPDHFLGLDGKHSLSSTGRCYPFDERMGEGHGLGEGVVVLVLKRLERAIKDRNPIRGVIRSTAIGIGSAQDTLVRKAYARADLRLEDTPYVEVLGVCSNDSIPEQLNSITEAFHGSPTRSLPLYVGSVEGAIGHTEGAAGLASLLKAIAMLEHESIPQVAGFNSPSPGLRLDQITIPSRMVPWPVSADITPRISLHSIGLDGTNAHAILERGPKESHNEATIQGKSPHLFVLSANSAASLRTMIEAHRDWIQQRAERTSLSDVSRTLLHHRTALPYRFSAVAEDHGSLLEALENGIRRANATKSIPVEHALVAVFTGQGAQWAGMGRELLLETTPCSVFRDSIRTSRNLLHDLGATWDLETELMRENVDSRLNEAELAYPATTAVQIALITLLRAQGLRPRAVVGHSSGEVAAAFAAGYISHAVAIKVAFHSGCMAAVVKAKGLGRGAMLSVGLGEREVLPYLERLQTGQAVVACINSPRSVTIAGDADAIKEVDERITAADLGIFHRLLMVETAYHSHLMKAVADEYRARLCNLQVETPSDEIIFISSVTGQVKRSTFDEEYWIANLVSPVQFSAAIQTLVSTQGVTGHHVCFVELGPHPALMGPVRQTLSPTELAFDYHGSLQRKVDAKASMLGLAGKLFEQGVEISWDAVSALIPGAETAAVQADLPPYPWEHSKEHWYESRVSESYRLRQEPYHHLLGLPVPDATTIEPRWRHFISHGISPWLRDHVIDGVTVLPESAYVCMAVEAVAQLFRGNPSSHALDTVALRDVSFPHVLAVSEGECVELQLSLRRQHNAEWAFYFAITALTGTNKWQEHATGLIEAVLMEQDQCDSTSEERHPPLASASERWSHEALYHNLADAGNTYGPLFATLDFLTISPDLTLSQSSLEVHDIRDSLPTARHDSQVIQPTTLNAIFQTAFPLTGQRLGSGSIAVSHIDELLISVSSSLQQKGSRLDISGRLMSTGLRTSVSDLSVLASDGQVLSVSGLECRRQSSKAREVYSPRHICYMENWTPAVEFLRVQDLSDEAALGTLLEHLGRKLSSFVTIGLGASVDLSREFLRGFQLNHKHQSSTSRIVLHDFVDVTHGCFHDAVDRLEGFPVQFRTLRPGTDPIARGFPPSEYDIVLTGSPEWLDQAGVLVKPDGFVILVVSVEATKRDDWCHSLASTRWSQLKELVTVRDKSGNIIVLFQPATDPPTTQIHILSYSNLSGATADWRNILQRSLQKKGHNVSTNLLTESVLETVSDNGTVVICESSDQHILGDSDAFNAIKKLLEKPSRVVWVSPDSLASFHRIRSISRTAHAENDDLRLVTIHFAAENVDSLIAVVNHAISHISNPSIPHAEREFLITQNGTVVVPRLEVSEELNQAFAMGRNAKKLLPFQNPNHTIILAADNLGAFVDQGESQASPLAAEAIEVETRALVMSSSDSSNSLGQIVGLVVAAGANVTSLSVGDRVVAIASVLGANRLRISASQARRLSRNVPSTLAAALLLDTMAAWHAIRGVAQVISSETTVLIHGARTPSGRAAVAVARSLGTRVTATAADSTEASLLKDEVGIKDEDVLMTCPSLHRHLRRGIFPRGLDAIIQIDRAAVPAEALAKLKPFGTVVVLANPTKVNNVLPKMPANTALHYVDVASLVQAHPDLTSSLIEQATATLEQIPLAGLNVPVHDVSEVADALTQINTETCPKVVLHAGPESIVPTIPAMNSHDPWTDDDATYVIAGSLSLFQERLIARIASRGARHIAALSCHAADCHEYHQLRAKLEAIRPDIRLYTLQCDVTSELSVNAAAAVLLSEGAPPVRGVIHATGFGPKSYCPFSRTSYQEFNLAARTKVDGTLALSRAFASVNLAFVLSVSSLASTVGASPEASYHIRRADQNILAYPDSALSDFPRLLTVNVGWIEDEIQASEEYLPAGVGLILGNELDHLIDSVLDAAVTDSETGSNLLTEAIIGLNPSSLRKSVAQNALFSQIPAQSVEKFASLTAESGGNSSSHAGVTFQQVVAEQNVEGIAAFVAQAITQQLSQLLSVAAANIDTQQSSILALGLDSLAAVELRNGIIRQFEAPLQAGDILCDQTVQGLTDKIVRCSKLVSAKVGGK